MFNVKDLKEKFIGVDEGGTLEIHGEDRVSWTKLNQTVPKLTLGHGYLHKHKVVYMHLHEHALAPTK